MGQLEPSPDIEFGSELPGTPAFEESEAYTTYSDESDHAQMPIAEVGEHDPDEDSPDEQARE